MLLYSERVMKMSDELSKVKAERDRQYEENVNQIVEKAKLEEKLKKCMITLSKIVNTKPHHAGQTVNEYQFQKLAADTLAEMVESNEEFECPDCGCKSFSFCDELKADGKFGPGNVKRCYECKGLVYGQRL